MILSSNNNSKQYVDIASRKLRKRKGLKLCKKIEKRLVKNSTKDEKLIYAFFLDIA